MCLNLKRWTFYLYLKICCCGRLWTRILGLSSITPCTTPLLKLSKTCLLMLHSGCYRSLDCWTGRSWLQRLQLKHELIQRQKRGTTPLFGVIRPVLVCVFTLIGRRELRIFWCHGKCWHESPWIMSWLRFSAQALVNCIGWKSGFHGTENGWRIVHAPTAQRIKKKTGQWCSKCRKFFQES